MITPPTKVHSCASPPVVGEISHHPIPFLRGVTGPAGCVEASFSVRDLPQLFQKKQGIVWVLQNGWALLASVHVHAAPTTITLPSLE